MQKELFANETANLLPFDGEVLYYKGLIDKENAFFYFDSLYRKIEWKNDEAFIFGKHYITKRKVAWYGEKPFSYTYSKVTKRALPWNKELIQLKNLCESITKSNYNSCLLNLYHDGNEGMAYHSDDESMLLKNGSVASVSLGAERKFRFKHKSNSHTITLLLENGSLLDMRGETQKNWLHRLPISKKVLYPRINLTFRTIVD
jgi:alkylated DNA repair dioxygenase AlkB